MAKDMGAEGGSLKPRGARLDCVPEQQGKSLREQHLLWAQVSYRLKNMIFGGSILFSPGCYHFRVQ